MGKPVAGEVVVLPFPQTNLQSGKRRPALVVADLAGDDLVLCQITRKARADGYSVSLVAADFERGRLGAAPLWESAETFGCLTPCEKRNRRCDLPAHFQIRRGEEFNARALGKLEVPLRLRALALSRSRGKIHNY